MATIVMSAEKVIEAAEKTIAGIIAEHGTGHRNNPQAGSWRSMYAWKDLEHAKKLLALAKHGDPVTLNENDVRVLF